jgi:hypothetical protein
MKNLLKLPFRKIISDLKLVFKKLTASNVAPGVIYKIIDIDPETLDVVIKCINTTTKLKDKIPQIIKDIDILAGLASMDACWLGYYYGQIIQKKSVLEAKKLTADVNFLMRNNRGKYRIHSLNRDGRISYLNTILNVSEEEHPITIAKNESMINQFDPSQACYIGILSGLDADRPTRKADFIKPNLRLVK